MSFLSKWGILLAVLYFLTYSYGALLTKNYSSYRMFPWCEPSDYMRYPCTSQEVVDIVKEAIRRNVTVKAFGARHSQTDIICTEGIPIDMHKLNSLKMNSDGVTATVGAGATLRTTTEFLRKNGRALRTTPAYGNITIGGAIGTGAHGSSIKYTSSISSQVVKLTVVNGLGELLVISDPEDLKAFRLHLGLLGEEGVGKMCDFKGITTSFTSRFLSGFGFSGILIRFSGKSDTYMSTSYGKDTVHFEFFPYKRKNFYDDAPPSTAGYQTILQEVRNKFNGQSHWGKSGPVYHDSDSLDLKLDPVARKNFVAAMDKFDPNELFINNFRRRMKGTGSKLDTDPKQNTVLCWTSASAVKILIVVEIKSALDFLDTARGAFRAMVRYMRLSVKLNGEGTLT